MTCEHGMRRVTRTEHDGSITVICNRFDGVEGKPLNSRTTSLSNRMARSGSPTRPSASWAITRASGNAGAADQCVPGDPRTGRTTVVAGDIERTLLLARRKPHVHRRIAPSRARSASMTSSRTEQGSPTAGSSAISATAPRTASAAMSRAICGAAGARASSTASPFSLPMGR